MEWKEMDEVEGKEWIGMHSNRVRSFWTGEGEASLSRIMWTEMREDSMEWEKAVENRKPR